MRLIVRGIPPVVVAALLVASGCGLEGLLNEYGGPEYTQPVSSIRGQVQLANPLLSVRDANDNDIKPFAAGVDGGTYQIDLYSGSYGGLRVETVRGGANLQAFVPPLAPESAVSGVDVTTESTATVELVQGIASSVGQGLPNLSDNLLCIMGKKIHAQAGQAGPVAALIDMMGRIATSAAGSPSGVRAFQRPELAADYTVLTSALNSDWLGSHSLDYDGDGTKETTTDVFDQAFVAAAQNNDLSAPPNPNLVRVVFAVDFNDGKLNGVCGKISRFKWVQDAPGKQMFFVGGIHKTSPVQSTTLDAMLGNRGGWTPNQIKMYDDGTHGDRVAGDNIWSLYFDLPPNTRIGYKYTWGHQGDLWSGTEEWPGNQRILEVVDVNSDGYVYRFDNFGDEATNKDIYNLNPASNGTLEWDEDLNGDGYFEAREGPAYVRSVCTLDPLATPSWVPKLTVDCSEFVP